MSRITVSDLVDALSASGIDVESILAKLKQEREPERGPAGNVDYIAHGSAAHAALLGLARAESDYDGPVVEGWKLIDAAYAELGIEAVTARVLGQRVRELQTAPPVTQSKDPRAPNFAPVMFDPRHGQGERPFRVTTEE